MACLIQFLFVFSLQFIAASASAQPTHTDTLTLIVAEIESSNINEMSYTVGYAGTVSKQCLRFERLLQLASDTELAQLVINHKNPVVRLYAYQALKQKKVAIPENIIIYFTNDHTVVKTLRAVLKAVRKLVCWQNRI